MMKPGKAIKNHSILLVDAAREGIALLKQAAIPNTRGEVLFFLKRITGLSEEKIFFGENRFLSQKENDLLKRCLQRRISREPLQYIVGDQPFWEDDIGVFPGVFIPRPETELLIQESAALSFKPKRILDLCTGTGCVAISLAKTYPMAAIDAVDLSKKALRIARDNAKRRGVSHRIKFYEGDLFSPLEGFSFHGAFDLVVSNPPYVSSRDFWGLAPEVKNFEPPLAFMGGRNGMEIIERILKDSEKYTRPGGYLLLEIGFNQFPWVREYVGGKDKGFILEKAIRDLNRIERVVCLRRKDL